MKNKIGVSLGLLLATGAVHAADQDFTSGRWYEGITIGIADYDLNVTDAEKHLPFTDAAGNSLSTDTYHFDTSTMSGQLFGGYRFNRHFALELNVASLGTVHRDGTFNIPNGGNLTGTLVSATRFKPTGVGLSVLGILPVSDSIDVFGRVGFFGWSIKAPFEIDSNGNRIAQDSPNDDGTDPFIGIGGNYHWSDFGVRLEYQRYTFGHPFNATNDTDANMFNASFSYNF
ncbi:MAG: outer membrane beta-barrel protein [Tahibacter sp.]